MKVWVDQTLCNACKRCLRACPYDSIQMIDGKAFITERCVLCCSCIEVCREKAILSDIPPREVPDFSEWKGVWVFVEQSQGRPLRVGLELLGKAQDLAKDLNQEVSAVLLGKEIKALAHELLEYGAKKVYCVEDPQLETYSTLAYTRIISDLVREHKPSILLLGATLVGRDLAPRLSRRLGAGLTADCTELSIDPQEKLLLQTRPAFGGNIMATIANRFSRPQMATVRPGVMEIKKVQVPDGEVIVVDKRPDLKDLLLQVVRSVKEPKGRTNLEEAKVIVAGGRGVGDKEGFRLIEELANVLGGEVAGTRVAVEEGWITQDRQVGQTGVTVRPELYIACGISGAIQHRAGMMNSRYIVAINKDPNAPIFQVADWGLIGDLHEIVPKMIVRLREVLK